jgi:hypothetical protein
MGFQRAPLVAMTLSLAQRAEPPEPRPWPRQAGPDGEPA